MQLSLAGHPLHTRSLTIVVSVGDDGRWHARGDVIDLRKTSLVPMMSDLQPAGIIHMMSIRAVLDPSTRRLASIETEQPFVAIEASEASRGECCRDPAPRLRDLVGETLDAGFSKRLSGVFGGPRGCSHLLTLFQLMATALPRALDLEAALVAELGATRQPGERPFRRAVFVDGNQLGEAAVSVGVQLSDFLTLPSSHVTLPLDRLAREFDVRVQAEVARSDLSLRSLRAAERQRRAETLTTAAWSDRSEELASLVGSPVVGGFAGRLFRLLGEEADRRTLLDTLLQLAPAYVQIMATLMEPHLVALASGAGGGSVARDSRGRPSVASIGGTPDSCFMWRVGGALDGRRLFDKSSDES